jgi:hypothetical protein
MHKSQRSVGRACCSAARIVNRDAHARRSASTPQLRQTIALHPLYSGRLRVIT